MNPDLQFDRAEFTEAPTMACNSCKSPLVAEYFAVNQEHFCGKCADTLRNHLGGQGSGAVRFLKAILFGFGAALLGMAVYAGVMIMANSEWALISIALGWLVGAAVRRGSMGRGGWRYQLLAVFLTYTAICAAYAVAGWFQTPDQHSVEFLIGLIIMAYAIPFLGGAENIIGLLIIGFGVWQAWQMNRPLQLEITGPHLIAPHSIPPPQPSPSADAGI
ncbi:MAG: hypothetical protein V4727_10790 [Verrucomicrobiota bacterium]